MFESAFAETQPIIFKSNDRYHKSRIIFVYLVYYAESRELTDFEEQVLSCFGDEVLQKKCKSAAYHELDNLCLIFFYPITT